MSSRNIYILIICLLSGILILIGVSTFFKNSNEILAEVPRYSEEDLESAQHQVHVRETRRNIRNLVTVRNEGYKTELLGGISNARFRVYNKSDFNIDKVKIAVTYILANGEEYQEEEVLVGAIESGETGFAIAPDTDRGVRVEAKVSEISDDDLGEISFKSTF